jgi:hypothetical protein
MDMTARKHNRSEMVAVLGPYEALPYYILYTYMTALVYERMDWIHVSQEGEQWLAVMNKVTNGRPQLCCTEWSETGPLARSRPHMDPPYQP